jgi:hypothetical protein
VSVPARRNSPSLQPGHTLEEGSKRLGELTLQSRQGRRSNVHDFTNVHNIVNIAYFVNMVNFLGI